VVRQNQSTCFALKLPAVWPARSGFAIWREVSTLLSIHFTESRMITGRIRGFLAGSSAPAWGCCCGGGGTSDVLLQVVPAGEFSLTLSCLVAFGVGLGRSVRLLLGGTVVYPSSSDGAWAGGDTGEDSGSSVWPSISVSSSSSWGRRVSDFRIRTQSLPRALEFF
jgi:hypothetical protein